MAGPFSAAIGAASQERGAPVISARQRGEGVSTAPRGFFTYGAEPFNSFIDLWNQPRQTVGGCAKDAAYRSPKASGR